MVSFVGSLAVLTGPGVPQVVENLRKKTGIKSHFICKMKLRNELPMLMLKMSRTYLDALRCHGHQSLWDPDVLPSIFHNAKKQYLVTTSPLSAFMESDQVQLDAASEVSGSDFRRALAQWVRENGDRRTGPIAMISKVDHGHLFSMYGCNIEDRACGSACKTVIRGLKLISV